VRHLLWAVQPAHVSTASEVVSLTYSTEQLPLPLPRRAWGDNIKMDLGEVGWGDVDCIGQYQDRNRWSAVVNAVLNLRVP
jgi:hypothetical protein